MKADYEKIFTDHLIPPDSLYKKKPFAMEDYLYLNSTGKNLLNLGDISNLDGSYDRECTKAYTKEYL